MKPPFPYPGPREFILAAIEEDDRLSLHEARLVNLVGEGSEAASKIATTEHDSVVTSQLELIDREVLIMEAASTILKAIRAEVTLKRGIGEKAKPPAAPTEEEAPLTEQSKAAKKPKQ